MQKIVPEDVGIVSDGFHDHVRDGRPTQIQASNPGFIKQSVHVRGKTVMESPCKENGLFGLLADAESPLRR